MIKIGFIGLGGMGRAQADAFATTLACEIAAGSDPSPDACKAFASQYPAANVFAHHLDLLKDTSIDAIIIATPTAYHADIAIAAMRAGRHVLVEKPMARSVEQCRRMMEC